MNDVSHLTTTAASPVADNQNSLGAGPRGPLLMQDWQELAHQNRERMPERVVHAKGWGVFGFFTATNVSSYTRAHVFAAPGRDIEIAGRFSNVTGELGAADEEQDVREFALKFYTADRNWNFVGYDSPIIFVHDPLKSPDIIRTQKRHRKVHLRSNTAAWDFWSLSPKSLQQARTLRIDCGLPSSPSFMGGFGRHTLSFWNAQGVRHCLNFPLKNQEGHRHIPNAEAASVVAATRESFQEDLFGAAEAGHAPRRTLYLKVMAEADAARAAYNPFDIAKVWPHREYPLVEVGGTQLDRNADNCFAHVEQSAFSPCKVVQRIGSSPGKLSQAHMFSNAGAHRYRIGTHYEKLSVSAPKCPVYHYHRDGAMRPDLPRYVEADSASYEPYSFAGPWRDASVREPASHLFGEADRWDNRDNNEDFGQADDMFRLLDEAQRHCLASDIADAIEDVSQEFVARQIAHFQAADLRYARLVIDALTARQTRDRRSAMTDELRATSLTALQRSRLS